MITNVNTLTTLSGKDHKDVQPDVSFKRKSTFTSLKPMVETRCYVMTSQFSKARHSMVGSVTLRHVTYLQVFMRGCSGSLAYYTSMLSCYTI